MRRWRKSSRMLPDNRVCMQNRFVQGKRGNLNQFTHNLALNSESSTSLQLANSSTPNLPITGTYLRRLTPVSLAKILDAYRPRRFKFLDLSKSIEFYQHPWATTKDQRIPRWKNCQMQSPLLSDILEKNNRILQFSMFLEKKYNYYLIKSWHFQRKTRRVSSYSKGWKVKSEQSRVSAVSFLNHLERRFQTEEQKRDP